LRPKSSRQEYFQIPIYFSLYLWYNLSVSLKNEHFKNGVNNMPENYITINSEKGSVNISADVIAVMASAAVAEVEGVAGLSNSVGNELYEFLGKRPGAKGVKARFEDERIIIDITVMIRYGYSLAKVAGNAQTTVIAAVESMTGVTPVVNLHVSGVAFDK